MRRHETIYTLTVYPSVEIDAACKADPVQAECSAWDIADRFVTDRRVSGPTEATKILNSLPADYHWVEPRLSVEDREYYSRYNYFDEDIATFEFDDGEWVNVEGPDYPTIEAVATPQDNSNDR